MLRIMKMGVVKERVSIQTFQLSLKDEKAPARPEERSEPATARASSWYGWTTIAMASLSTGLFKT